MVACPESGIALGAASRNDGQQQAAQEVKVGGQRRDVRLAESWVVDDECAVAHGHQCSVLAQIVRPVGLEQRLARAAGPEDMPPLRVEVTAL